MNPLTKIILLVLAQLILIYGFLAITLPFYVSISHWNEKAIKADCLAVEYQIKANTDRGFKWIGSIGLSLANCTKFIPVVDSCCSDNAVKNYLIKNYPLNSTVNCYYQSDNFCDIELELKSYENLYIITVYIASMIYPFFFIGTAILQVRACSEYNALKSKLKPTDSENLKLITTDSSKDEESQ